LRKKVDLDLARIMLQELQNNPIRRTQFLKRALIHCGTPASFDNLIRIFFDRKWIEKGPKKNDPYHITEKGLKFLRGLNNE